MIIKSISEFTNGGSLQVNDAFVIARGGLNYYLTGQALIDATSVDLSTIQTDIALLQSDRLKLDGSNSPMSGNLSLGSNKITDLGTPTLATDASNKSYVDSNFLKITGGILTGYLTLNSDPVNPLHAATKQYVDAQLSGVGAIPVDTNDLPEGTDGSAVGGGAEVDGNRYYFTNQRFDNRFSSKTTDNLAEGAINKYFTTTRFNTNFSSKTTDNLLEGSINLYYTDARVRAAISVTAPLTYDSVTGVIGLNEAALKPTFGTDNQIPFMNGTNDDFDYSANLIFDGNNLALGALINSNYKLNIESSTGTIGLRSLITASGGIGSYGISTGVGTSANTGTLGFASGSSVLNIGVRGDATQTTAGDNIGGYFYANAGAGNYAVQLVDGTETLTGGKFLKDTGNGKANWANIYLADIVDYAASTVNTIYTANDSLTGNRTITGSNFELLFQTMGKFSVHSHANNIDNIVFEVRSDATYHGFIVQDHNTGVHMLACRNGAVEISDAYFLPSTDGTSGQVLKTDGAGSVSFGSLYEADILDLGTYAKVGTYTDGYIPRWNATSNTLASGSIQDNGSGNVAINSAVNSNQALRITNSTGNITTYSVNSYTNATGTNFSLYGSSNGAAVNNIGVFGISSNATGNNIGVSGSTNGISPLEVNLKDIGVIAGLGTITGATLPSAGLVSSINQSNNQDSYGIYINVSNPGTGNAYIGVLKDGSEGAGKVLTSDANGVATWQTFSESSGIFGISDATGTYTYYSTLTLAMAGASSGDTIELFADIEITDLASTTTYKDGVKINGNGHTITMSVDDDSSILEWTSTQITIEMSDITLIRTGRTNLSLGSCFNMTGTATARFKGVRMVNTYRDALVFYHGTCHGVDAEGYYYGIFGSTASFTSCRGKSNSNGKGISVSSGTGKFIDCIGETESGQGLSGRNIYNSTGIANTSGQAIQAQNAYNCTGIANTSYAFYGTNCWNCNGISVSSNAYNVCNVYNSTGISTSSNAVNNGNGYVLINSYFESTSNYVLNIRQSKVRGCTVECKWNNAGGHALSYLVLSTGCHVNNNTFIVANAGAYCITGTVGSAASISNNSFVGSTTPINTTNISQTIVNTSDSQGNILN